jgi:hypothetical protein
MRSPCSPRRIGRWAFDENALGGTVFWLTGCLVFLTPMAVVVILASEAFGGGGVYYHWLPLILLAVVAVIWIFVIRNLRKDWLRDV